jgi:hypothetical protein
MEHYLPPAFLSLFAYRYPSQVEKYNGYHLIWYLR